MWWGEGIEIDVRGRVRYLEGGDPPFVLGLF
jgi:hypothetical protein